MGVNYHMSLFNIVALVVVVLVIFLDILIFFRYFIKNKPLKNKNKLSNKIPNDVPKGKHVYMISVDCTDHLIYMYIHKRLTQEEVEEQKIKVCTQLNLPIEKVNEIGVLYVGKS